MNTPITKRPLREPYIKAIQEHGQHATFFGPIASEYAEAVRRGFSAFGEAVTIKRLDTKRMSIAHPNLMGRHFDVVPLGV